LMTDERILGFITLTAHSFCDSSGRPTAKDLGRGSPSHVGYVSVLQIGTGGTHNKILRAQLYLVHYGPVLFLVEIYHHQSMRENNQCISSLCDTTCAQR